MTDTTYTSDQYTKARRRFHAERRDAARIPTRQPSRFGREVPARDGYLSMHQIADRLGITYNAVASHRWRGSLPFPTVRIGGFVYATVADVEAYLAEQEAA